MAKKIKSPMPRTVPILSQSDMICQTLHNGKRSCLVGWTNIVFPMNRRKEVFAVILKSLPKILRALYMPSLKWAIHYKSCLDDCQCTTCEKNRRFNKAVNIMDVSEKLLMNAVVSFNDRGNDLRTERQNAAIWNQAMKKLGYTVRV